MILLISMVGFIKLTVIKGNVTYKSTTERKNTFSQTFARSFVQIHNIDNS